MKIKKILSLICIVIFILALCGCGDKTKTENTTTNARDIVTRDTIVYIAYDNANGVILWINSANGVGQVMASYSTNDNIDISNNVITHATYKMIDNRPYLLSGTNSFGTQITVTYYGDDSTIMSELLMDGDNYYDWI